MLYPEMTVMCLQRLWRAAVGRLDSATRLREPGMGGLSLIPGGRVGTWSRRVRGKSGAHPPAGNVAKRPPRSSVAMLGKVNCW